MIRLQVLYPYPYPLPLHLLSSSPLPSLPPLAHPLWFTVLCGGCSASADVSTRACPEGPRPPRQASEYLLACLSVFLSFGLAVHSRIFPIPRFCALAISSHLQTQQGYDEPYFYMREMDRPCLEELNELRQSERHRLKPTDPHLSQHHPLPLPAWSNSPEGAFCESTVVISIDRSSRKSS